ncbi:hypothetical protein GP486_001819 [Trichoglossum hirsutum]|uniref:Symplekin/Pta1 N-terminal domain-containing protein n=1 Tax=Trichoglossum hirsutum TaxID=265104 RepID=A0A9P8LFE8_9PEZI|nr:hypothetical protein GP486_001819 [Trichoglossum hirsutum]
MSATVQQQSPSSSVGDQLAQLDAARNLVLGDAAYYPQIVQGILPIIGATARHELRRWGAEFLAETFASPILAMNTKESLSLIVLDTLLAMLVLEEEKEMETGVLKSVVQFAASVYPLVFRHTITNPNDAATWEKMNAIKTRILRLWDTAAPGVRICCMKFAQKVIQVQTPGTIADPRRPDQNEISLALVPRNHPLIPPPNLEAQASGLLDRLLNIFQENTSDAVLVNATLNCLGVLIKTRPSVSNKILNSVLNFNPLKLANSPMTAKIKIMVKSMERSTRALLLNANKRNPTGPLAGRIQQHLDRLMQSRMDIFDEGSRKRVLPSEPTDGLDPSKRLRLGTDIHGTPTPPLRLPPIPPLPMGPISFAQLFTLTADEELRSFDGIRTRYTALSQEQRMLEPSSLQGFDDDDDDYEPDFQPAEDDEQILNKLDNVTPGDGHDQEPEVALGPFKLPPPSPFSGEELEDISQGTVIRIFEFMNSLDEPSPAKRQKTGINRLAASNYDRDSWITVIARLATRTSTGLETDQDRIETEDGDVTERRRVTIGNKIRESLYVYVLEDFRKRIDIAIGWLTEEWYNERMQMKAGGDAIPRYEKWAIKVLDGILPYLDAKDNRVFTRYLSELPDLSKELLERVKTLCLDPERVQLVITSLQ